MRNAVVGFSGGIASGKSSLSSAVSEALGWPRASFGAYVRLVAAERGVEPTREICQKIGGELIEKDAHDFCVKVLAQGAWRPGSPLILDGIRHLLVADLLAGMARPADFLLVFVQLSRGERESRLRSRDGEEQPLERFESHSTESQVADLRARADLVVDGDRSVDQMTEEVVRFLSDRLRSSSRDELRP
jgi:dephospho-CoA kinase